MTETLARMENLQVSFPGSPVPVLKGINLQLEAGQTLALTGPSGCGKSLTARALCGLLPPEANWSGSISWLGQPLLQPQDLSWQQMRGRGAAMVLQEPATSLNPVLRVGDQIAESVRLHHRVSAGQAQQKAVDLLAEVQMPDPAAVSRCYPHNLSGGMRQRALLAAALACDPLLLIADEVTTALDLTVQREILALLDQTRKNRNMGLMLISHDLDVASLLSDRVVAMAGGRIISGPDDPIPPVPEPEPIQLKAPPGNIEPLLSARGLVVRYPGGRGSSSDSGITAVAGVDLLLKSGQVMGLTGESGCGKSTLARALCRQLNPAAGSLELLGEDFLLPAGKSLRRMKKKVQMIFQDPGASLNPRQKIGDILDEALRAVDGGQSVADLLEEVGLTVELVTRYPHELSGGQRQRVAVARCLAVQPRVIIADEVTSALDADSTNRLLGLLGELVSNRKIALLLISHDLSVLHRLCGQVAVMYGGRIMEIFPVGTTTGEHPYTKTLIDCSPAILRKKADPWQGGRRRAGGSKGVGSGSGCPWMGQCAIEKQGCAKEIPDLLEVSPGHWLRCPHVNANPAPHFIDT